MFVYDYVYYVKYAENSIIPCLSMISISSSICCGSLPFRTAVRTSIRCFLFYTDSNFHNSICAKICSHTNCKQLDWPLALGGWPYERLTWQLSAL